MLYQVIILAVRLIWILRYIPSTFIVNKCLKLFDSVVLKLHVLLGVSIDLVVGLELFLKLDDGLVSFV